MWPFSLFKKKELPKPKLADAYRLTEEALKKLENAAYIMQDTEDFNKLTDLDRLKFIRNLKEYYKNSHFQTSSLRDELILTLGKIPGTKLKRKSN